MTYSVTTSDTFSIIHARKLSAKVAADMHLCAQYYGKPSEGQIRDYAEELAQFLNAGYVSEYEFGFQKDGKRVVTWRYTVDENGTLTSCTQTSTITPRRSAVPLSVSSSVLSSTIGVLLGVTTRSENTRHSINNLTYESAILLLPASAERFIQLDEASVFVASRRCER
jgi:Bacterial HORMA domain family 1